MSVKWIVILTPSGKRVLVRKEHISFIETLDDKREAIHLLNGETIDFEVVGVQNSNTKNMIDSFLSEDKKDPDHG